MTDPITTEPDPPLGVRLVYIDGSMRSFTALFYAGFVDDMHLWEAVDPQPDMIVKELQVDIMPAHTTVTVRR